MKKDAPKWALEKATPQDYQRAQAAYENATWQLTWPEDQAIRAWAKQQGWPAPRLNFKGHFIKKTLANEASFALARQESGLQILIPKEYYQFPDQELKTMDRWYEERENMGALGRRPVNWGLLVEGLREIRRAIEADVVVEIEGQKLKRVGRFLTWAHERYPLLEEGYDSWYGDDNA